MWGSRLNINLKKLWAKSPIRGNKKGSSVCACHWLKRNSEKISSNEFEGWHTHKSWSVQTTSSNDIHHRRHWGWEVITRSLETVLLIVFIVGGILNSHSDFNIWWVFQPEFLEQVKLNKNSLQSLKFGRRFNQSLKQLTQPQQSSELDIQPSFQSHIIYICFQTHFWLITIHPSLSVRRGTGRAEQRSGAFFLNVVFKKRKKGKKKNRFGGGCELKKKGGGKKKREKEKRKKSTIGRGSISLHLGGSFQHIPFNGGGGF